jgi:putative copper export protein
MNPVFGNINHWLHLTGAIIAIGGTITLRLAIHPIVHKMEGEAGEELQRSIRRRMTPLIHSAVALLLITGFINMARVFQGGVPPLYTGLFAIKVLLAMAVFTIAILLTVSSPALDNFNAKRGTWMLLNILLGLIVVLISAILRWMPPA